MRSALMLVLLAASACSTTGDAKQAEGATTSEPVEATFPSDGILVMIVTKVDPGALGGAFVIEEGSEALGCSSGTYEDSVWGIGHRKAFTCEVGSFTGTFAVNVQPDSIDIETGPPERWRGTWGIDGSASTGDFVGLQGFGVFEVVFDSSGHPEEETLSGNVFG